MGIVITVLPLIPATLLMGFFNSLNEVFIIMYLFSIFYIIFYFILLFIQETCSRIIPKVVMAFFRSPDISLSTDFSISYLEI